MVMGIVVLIAALVLIVFVVRFIEVDFRVFTHSWEEIRGCS